MYTKQLKKIVVGAALALGVVASAFAQPMTFDLVWSGASLNNDTGATGSITFDPAVELDIGFADLHFLSGSSVTDLSITFTGDTAAKGSFSLASFESFYFSADSELNFSKQLVGQVMENGCQWGKSTGACDGFAGDFNLFGTPASGSWLFQLRNGEDMVLTSFAPRSDVPEPGSLALVALGLAGFAAARRKANSK